MASAHCLRDRFEGLGLERRHSQVCTILAMRPVGVRNARDAQGQELERLLLAPRVIHTQHAQQLTERQPAMAQRCAKRAGYLQPQ